MIDEWTVFELRLWWVSYATTKHAWIPSHDVTPNYGLTTESALHCGHYIDDRS